MTRSDHPPGGRSIKYEASSTPSFSSSDCRIRSRCSSIATLTSRTSHRREARAAGFRARGNGNWAEPALRRRSTTSTSSVAIRSAYARGDVLINGSRTLAVDLTEPELYRNGFPHNLFVELREQGSVFRHPRASIPNQSEGVEFWAVIGPVRRAARLFVPPAPSPQPCAAGPARFDDGRASSGAALRRSPGNHHSRVRKLASN